jgi:hypothetical protein
MPRVDEWVTGHIKYFETATKALKQFEERRDPVSGSDGISASVLLDLKECRVLWFYLSANPPHGVLHEKRFERVLV